MSDKEKEKREEKRREEAVEILKVKKVTNSPGDVDNSKDPKKEAPNSSSATILVRSNELDYPVN